MKNQRVNYREIEKELLGKDESKLYLALAKIKSKEDVSKFLRDILTFEEIKEITNRLKAAQMLSESSTVRAIASETKMSSATISRINYWLQNGTGGYKLALKALHHTSKSSGKGLS